MNTSQRLGSRDIEAAALAEILDGLEISSFVSDLDEVFGTSSAGYSTGPLQRLPLARAVIRDAKVYLLDEPFPG